MPDVFVPVSSVPVKANGAGFVPFTPKTLTSSAAKAVATQPVIPPTVAASANRNGNAQCSKPTVTLERQGEIVTGIKILCGCGEVVELTCVY